MKVLKHLGALWLAFTGLGFAGGDTRAPAPSSMVEPLFIEACHDGDTCEGRTSLGARKTLRFRGIDAPEVSHGRKMGQRFGPEAREFVRRRLVGKTVYVEYQGVDVFARNLALLWDSLEVRRQGAASVNEALVAEGLAFAYRNRRSRPMKLPWAERAEAEALKNRRGFWAVAEEARPVDPSEFRKQGRNLAPKKDFSSARRRN